MPVNLSTRAVTELNVMVTSCFSEGANDAVNALQDLYSADGTPIATAMDLVRRVSMGQGKEMVFFYPELSFDIADFGAADANPEEGIKFYEHREKAGNYKGQTIPVKLEDFLDDVIGQYRVVFYKLGGTLVRSPLRLIEKTLYDACTGTSIVSGIDGKPLISQQHLQRPGEAYDATRNPYVSNDIVQPGGMTFPNFAALYSAYLGLPDENGVPLEDNIPQWLWFDPDYMGQAMDICFNDRPSTLQGGGNQWKGKVKPMMVRRLKGTGSWGLASSYDALDRSMNYIEREALKMRGLFTNPEDPIVRRERKLTWQVDGRITCGAGHYNKIMRSRKG